MDDSAAEASGQKKRQPARKACFMERNFCRRGEFQIGVLERQLRSRKFGKHRTTTSNAEHPINGPTIRFLIDVLCWLFRCSMFPPYIEAPTSPQTRPSTPLFGDLNQLRRFATTEIPQISCQLAARTICVGKNLVEFAQQFFDAIRRS